MTLTQLEYILALDQHRHFIEAANHCFVTQPTLSMGVKKLEEELGVSVFNRKVTPIQPTAIGLKIIERAKQILKESRDLKTFVEQERDDLAGEFKIGVIPTLAPYVVPSFFKEFRTNYPKVKLIIEENQTHVLVDQLEREAIDVAILVTPIKSHTFGQMHLYDEPFVGYFSDDHTLLAKKNLQPTDIQTDDLWVLNQGHCFREQVLNICNVNHSDRDFIYESGSIETLRKMVDLNTGYTLIPWAAISDLTEESISRVRYFEDPQPVREISLLHTKSSLKIRLIDLLKETIRKGVDTHLLGVKGDKIDIQ